MANFSLLQCRIRGVAGRCHLQGAIRVDLHWGVLWRTHGALYSSYRKKEGREVVVVKVLVDFDLRAL